MGKQKSKERKLKRLNWQFNKVSDQPLFKPDSFKYDGDFNKLPILTRAGRILNKIQTVENTK
jgi:hypothetical protein